MSSVQVLSVFPSVNRNDILAVYMLSAFPASAYFFVSVGVCEFERLCSHMMREDIICDLHSSKSFCRTIEVGLWFLLINFCCSETKL